MKKVVFTGGGSGGHIFPLIAVAREMRVLQKDIKLIYVGPITQSDKIFLEGEGFEICPIFSGKLRRYFSLENIVDFFKIPIGFAQSFSILFVKSPDIIFSKGGFGSVPVVLAGWFLRIPIIIHESDAVPGLSNRILSPFSKKILVSFPKTQYFSLKKMEYTGNPVRKEILDGSREEAINKFELIGGRPILLILGGSQGAKPINDKIISFLPHLIKEKFEIIHQVGEKNYKDYKKELEANYPGESMKFYHLFDFLRENGLADAMAVCDLIINRAGSGSIFEIAAVGKPSILIPLSHSAQDHQLRNAYAYAENGAAVIIEEENLSLNLFIKTLEHLFSYPNKLEIMGQQAKKFSQIDAAKKIAGIILKMS
jgi:UDP-N-acetylglucosamine--N-acetylmuramyl-(pentapeptide) pyrophosphoryl-undecaprenol N-acetylglucosamine transferase